MTTAIDRLTLHFVRHGETPGNAERRFQKPDVPLSDNGRAQAAAVAETLAASTNAELILASDYARTLETASIIGGRLGLPVTEEPALRERNFGVARGRVYSEFTEETMASWREWDHRIEEGESWSDVYDRVVVFLDRLRSSPPARELILVSHGGTMNVVLHYLAGKGGDTFALAPMENCAVRRVELSTHVP